MHSHKNGMAVIKTCHSQNNNNQKYKNKTTFTFPAGHENGARCRTVSR